MNGFPIALFVDNPVSDVVCSAYGRSGMAETGDHNEFRRLSTSDLTESAK